MVKISKDFSKNLKGFWLNDLGQNLTEFFAQNFKKLFTSNLKGFVKILEDFVQNLFRQNCNGYWLKSLRFLVKILKDYGQSHKGLYSKSLRILVNIFWSKYYRILLKI